MRAFAERAIAFLDRAPAVWKEGVESNELDRRLLWFLLLRMSVISLLLLLGAAKPLLIPHLSIGRTSLLSSAAVLAVLNVLFWLHYRKAAACEDFEQGKLMAMMNLQAQIILDFLILGFLVYECGVLESPLVYFFLFHNTLSCLFFPRRISFFHTALSVGILLTIQMLLRAEAIPETHFILPQYQPHAPGAYDFYILGGIAFVYFAAWYLVSTITDSLRMRERQLEQKIRELTEMDREKTRYMLVTTHELKAPFAAIQSYVNVALEGYAGEVPDKLRDILRKIHLRCGTLSRMLVDMIQLTNLSSSKDVATARFDLGRALVEAVVRFRSQAVDKNVQFDLEAVPKGRCYVEAHLEQVQVLLNNVLGNAVAYSYPDTRIRVELEDGPQCYTIRVSDHGIGVKKEHLEKVFLEHFRSEKAVEMNPNSTGLGLAISRRIMDIHGGRIWLESPEGKGTTVWIKLPKSQPGKEAS
ncbi:MAG TPA: hypothetical protein DCM05_14285 [Elusimicrobia bacterium]|nr:hypothetical protein [Elusimicrobiota bacterium]